MKLFNKSTKQENSISDLDFSIIFGPGLKVSGHIKSDAKILIDCMYDGKIETTADLEILEDAIVDAKILSNNTMIAGQLEGKLSSTHQVNITSTAVVNSNINCDELTVEKGALITSKISTAIESKVK